MNDFRWILIYWILSICVSLAPRSQEGDELVKSIALWLREHNGRAGANA